MKYVMKIVNKKVITMQLIESPCVMQSWFLKRCIFFKSLKNHALGNIKPGSKLLCTMKLFIMHRFITCVVLVDFVLAMITAMITNTSNRLQVCLKKKFA